MKKILLVLIMVLCLFGCKKKEKEIELLEDEVILEGIKYKFDQDDSSYGINYKVASNLKKFDTGNAINYKSEEIDGSSYFVFRIFHYTNKTIDYAIKDTTTEYDSKEEIKVGDVDYTKVHFTNYNGANTYLYYHKHNKDVYAFCFTAHIDISRLENIFLERIVY